MQPFGTRVHGAIATHGRLCVGIDPHAELLAAWGLPDDADGLASFCATCVEAFAGRLAIVKPQSAFFERHGSAGIAVLEQTIAAFRGAGTQVLLDVKRGDLGSTMVGYADAYARPTSLLQADAITVSPYLGFESLRPVLDAARDAGTGVFVLALTSNPQGGQVQQAVAASGATVAGEILAAVRAENAGAEPLGSVGVVIGATVTGVDEDLDVHGPILAPGYGAQGGTAAALRELLGPAYAACLPSTSRGVLRAGPSVAALRAAADACAAELG